MSIKIEVADKYREELDLLKQVIPNIKNEEITSDNEMVEVLIDSFIGFIKEQAEHDHKHNEDGGCCGGEK